MKELTLEMHGVRIRTTKRITTQTESGLLFHDGSWCNAKTFVMENLGSGMLDMTRINDDDNTGDPAQDTPSPGDTIEYKTYFGGSFIGGSMIGAQMASPR